MRKKQLLAFLMVGALSVNMAPAAAFAAEDAVMEASAEDIAGETDSSEDLSAEEVPTESTEVTETPEEIPAEPTEVPEEVPAEQTPAAQEETETDAAETTEEILTHEETAEHLGTIVIGETAYSSFKDAIDAAPEHTDPSAEATCIKITGDIEIAESVEIPAGKSILIAAAEEGTMIKRAAGFTESIFKVTGGTLQIAGAAITDAEGNAVGTGTVTVDGSGDGVTGSLVEVQSGIFGLSDGVTFTNNITSGNGGAISNAVDGQIYLMGGTITGNQATAGGGIYSEGIVNLSGTVTVSDNYKKDAFEVKSNVVLAGNGVIQVTGAVTGSAVGVDVQDAKAGKKVVALAESVTDVELADVLAQISYEGDASLKLGEDGTLISAQEPTVTPTPAEEQVKVSGKSITWTGHNSVKIKFRSNVKGTYYIDWVKRGKKAPTIDSTKTGAPIDADIDVTAKVTDLPEEDVDIYVCVISDKDKSNYGSLMFQPISAERPSAPVTQTPTPTPHEAKIANISDSKVQGFEKALVFYPNTFYEFKVIGAGTQNNDPGEGDTRWVPLYWSMSSNPAASDQHQVWKIGAAGGIYTDVEKSYNIYVFFQKEVHNGSEWQTESGSIQSVQYQFKAAPLAKTTGTPTPGADGTGTGGTGTAEDGTYSGDGTDDATPTSYAENADGTSKTAVSTGDESPIGTMMALAAASILAGGYVVVRRRKKEN